MYFKSILIVACLSLVMCQEEAKPTQASPIVTAIPEPPSPVCIHQSCFERPNGLDCNVPAYGLCLHYTVQYEHHCDCDQWAPAKQESK
jgi:hypothetical protein